MGNRESAGKLALFTDPLAQFDESELAAYIAAGYELGLVPAGQGGVGMLRVDRGDPAAFDFVTGGLTKDGAAHDLDCSAIVPAGAQFIEFEIEVRNTAADQYVIIRKKGIVNGINACVIYSHTANLLMRRSMIVPCNAGRVVEYLAQASVWTDLSIVVSAWYL